MKGEMVKAKVFGSNAPELCAGVDGEDLEGFWLEGFAPPCEEKLGWVSHLLKADRGERAGKYAVIWSCRALRRAIAVRFRRAGSRRRAGPLQDPDVD